MKMQKTVNAKYLHTLFFILLFCSLKVLSQPVIFSQNALAEKIYLQLDSKVYANSETVFFKAVLTNAINHEASLLSKVLYVDLVDKNKEIKITKIIELEDGFGYGHIDLTKDISEGRYLIRAYTKWNQNFKNDFLYEEYIQVVTSLITDNSISDLEVTEGKSANNYFKLKLNPYLIDSLHKRKLKVFLDYGKGSSKKISVKATKEKDYFLEDSIPKNTDLINLRFETRNKETFSKKIAVNKRFIDLQFFPESGDLVDGLTSMVGFKAVDVFGRGVLVEGTIVDENDNLITLFKSNHLGMGLVGLRNVSAKKKYFAKIKSNNSELQQKKYALPAIKEIGTLLAVSKARGDIVISVRSNYLSSEDLKLTTTCRGVNYHNLNFSLKKGKINLRISKKSLPEGVVKFTLKNDLNRPIAERLYFNERLDDRLVVNVATNEETYRQRELVDLSISTKNAKGDDVETDVSVLVIDDELKGSIQSERQNILSYFLLNSDLKGTIESPGFYFSDGKVKYFHLDVLMLTQGWSRYKFEDPLTNQKMKFEIEKKLSVDGVVRKKLFNKKSKNIGVGMMTFGKHKTFQTQNSGENGEFRFYLPTEYSDYIEVLFQTSKYSEKSNYYKVVLAERSLPEIRFEPKEFLQKNKTVIAKFQEDLLVKETKVKAFETASDVTNLGEVIVKGYLMTENRKLVAERFGLPNTVISGKQILEKEERWSTGLFSVLMYSFPEINVEMDSIGDLYIDIPDSESTFLVLDGEVVERQDYPHVAVISSNQISSVELIKDISSFEDLFLEKFPDLNIGSFTVSDGNSTITEMSNGGVKFNSSVVAIYTKAGVGLGGTKKPTGITGMELPVFSSKKEFYQPKYVHLEPEDWLKPDQRSLIHWEPGIKVSKTGKAAITYYNGDLVGKVKIVVEAISKRGELGYKEFVYHVTKR
jgi:hypothetical protein